jgi:hypothetical protein
VNFIDKIFGGAFGKVLKKEQDGTTRLGNPLGRDSGPFLVRMNNMSMRTGGRGFCTPKKEPRVDVQGMSRGQRRRRSREWANQAERERQERDCQRRATLAKLPFEALRGEYGSL